MSGRDGILVGMGLFGAAAAWGIGSLFSERPGRERSARLLALLAFLWLSVVLALRLEQERRLPLGDLSSTLLSTAWLATAVSIVLSRKGRLPALLPFALPTALLMLAAALLGTDPERRPQGGPMLAFHAGSALLGYAAFATAFATGLMYLLQDRALRGKAGGASVLPPLETLDRWSGRAAAWGFPFFSAAVGTGAIRAYEKGGRWFGDPLIVGTTLAWILYGAVLAARHGARLSGRRISLLSVIAFGIGALGIALALLLGRGHG